jgi:hypothetical protein
MKKLAKLALIAAVLGSSVAMASTATTSTINTKSLAAVAKGTLKAAPWYTILPAGPATYVVNYNQGQAVSVTIGELSDPLRTATPVIVTTNNGAISPTTVRPGSGTTFSLPTCEEETCTDTVVITPTGTPVFGDRGTADINVFTGPAA